MWPSPVWPQKRLPEPTRRMSLGALGSYSTNDVDHRQNCDAPLAWQQSASDPHGSKRCTHASSPPDSAAARQTVAVGVTTTGVGVTAAPDAVSGFSAAGCAPEAAPGLGVGSAASAAPPAAEAAVLAVAAAAGSAWPASSGACVGCAVASATGAGVMGSWLGCWMAASSAVGCAPCGRPGPSKSAQGCTE